MAAQPDNCDFDPLAPSEFLDSFIRGLDYEQRRQLTARGGSSGGGSGRRSRLAPGGASRSTGRRAGSGRRDGSGNRLSAAGSSRIREAKRIIRANAKATGAVASVKERHLAAIKAELKYQRRIRQPSAQINRELRGLESLLKRKIREDRRAATRERRLLKHFLTPAKRRTRYQRRVVSSVTRQIERGERPSLPSRSKRVAGAAPSLRFIASGLNKRKAMLSRNISMLCR
jgi:hypothetical protein